MEQNQTSAQSAPSVQKALQKHGLDCAVIELSDSTRTVSDAAAEIGCDVGQIVKSLIYKTQSTSQPVLVLVSGLNRLNERSVEHQLGGEVTKANADFVDKALMEFDDVWAAAGTPNTVFNIKSTDLVAMTNGTVISIK